MNDNVMELSLVPFSDEVNDWLVSNVGSKYNPNIILKLFFLYFEKVLAQEVEVSFPAIKIQGFQNKTRYVGGDTQRRSSFEKLLETANESLFSSLIEWSSFDREDIHLTGLEGIWEMDIEEFLDWSDKQRLKKILTTMDEFMTEKQQHLFTLLPQPVMDSMDYPYDRKVIYLYSRKLSAYLTFSRQNEQIISNQFGQEHRRILQALEGIKKPLQESWIPEMTRETEDFYMIGFYFGTEIENEISIKSINWNFFICLYVLEKLLELADSFFYFYDKR